MTLRKTNNILAIVVMALGIYIMLVPFLPEFTFRLKQLSKPANGGAPYNGQLAGTSNDRQPPPKDNRIVIPSIQLDETVKTGGNIWVINDGGTWLRPNTPSPAEGGNSVIVGHRYYRSQVSTFYNLDKVKVGDRLGVYWEGKEYVYKVSETKTVPATATEIESPTPDTRLTIYTCTPLWTARDRLVIIALPENN